MKTTLLRWFMRFHNAVYRLSRGAVGGLLSGAPVLLLTTVGRRSGKTSTTPLLFLPDGERLVVVASYGGIPKIRNGGRICKPTARAGWKSGRIAGRFAPSRPANRRKRACGRFSAATIPAMRTTSGGLNG